MINKPQNEGESRKPSRLRFFLRLIFSILVVGYCVSLNLHRCSIKAYASDWDTRDLTPQETIGLYGNQIQLTYTGIDEIDHLFPLQLIGVWDTPHYWPTLSSDLSLFPSGPGGSWDDYNFNALWFYPSLTQQYIDAYTSDLNRAPFLIYGAKIPFFVTSSSIAHPNIQFNVDFNFTLDIIQFDQYVLFSRDQESRNPGWSSVISDFTGLTSNHIQNMVNNIGGTAYGQSVVTPFPSYVDSESGINMGMIHINYGSLLASDTWRYLGQDFHLNGCEAYSSLGEGSWFLVYIQCPQLTSNYFPPIPETTEPIVTTRPDFTTPLYTYDLSPLETNQINQIRLQNEQLQVEYAQLQGINYICWKLDQIYNEMVQRGEIPVNFLPGDDFAVPTNIKNFIGDQLTTYTMASMDFTNVYRPFTSFMGIFDGYNWLDSFAVLGGFSLAFGVFCWFVFRGRGGGA